MKLIEKKQKVLFGIIKILQNNGFELNDKGDMVRISTGCKFSAKCLVSFSSVMEFQIKWEYY